MEQIGIYKGGLAILAKGGCLRERNALVKAHFMNTTKCVKFGNLKSFFDVPLHCILNLFYNYISINARTCLLVAY